MKKTPGGTTNKEKQRQKAFLMVRKGKRAVSAKMKRSAGAVERAKGREVKKLIKSDGKRRRRT